MESQSKTKTILAARKHFADNILAMVADQHSEHPLHPVASHVDIEEFCQRYVERAEKWVSGEFDRTFTFLQYAFYLQTGESVALLP